MGRGGRLVRNAAAGGIEFVAPRADLFGTGFEVLPTEDEVGPASFGEEPPTHRWGTAMAVLAVVGLVAVGIVAAAPWSDDAAPAPTTLPTSPTAPTTSAPSTAVPTTTAGTLPAGLDDGPTGYLLDAADVPDGYELQWANRPSEPQTDPTGTVRLWAAPNATRTDGSWIAVEVFPVSGGTWRLLPMAGAARVAVGNGVGSGGTDHDGVTYLQWPIDDGHDARITAHGRSLDELVAIAAGASLDDGGQVVLAEPSILDGMQAVIAGAGLGWGLDYELLGSIRSTIAWIGPDDAQLTLATLDADPGRDKTLYDFLLAPVDGEPFTGPKTFWAVGDLTLVVGRLAAMPGTTVKWTTGDATMLLTGELPVTDLVDLATKVRPGTGAEWLADYRQALTNSSDEQAAANTFMGDPIASGTTASGLTWDVRLSSDASAASVEVSSGSGTPDTGGTWAWYLALDEAHVDVTLTPSTSYAVAVLPIGTGARDLRVTGGWGQRSEPLVTVTDPATQTQLLVGVIEVPEIGPFTAAAVDATGTVIASATTGDLVTS